MYECLQRENSIAAFADIVAVAVGIGTADTVVEIGEIVHSNLMQDVDGEAPVVEFETEERGRQSVSSHQSRIWA